MVHPYKVRQGIFKKSIPTKEVNLYNCIKEYEILSNDFGLLNQNYQLSNFKDLIIYKDYTYRKIDLIQKI